MDWSYPIAPNETCASFNASVEVRTCFGRGRCLVSTPSLPVRCSCPGYYDPISFCEKSFHEVYNGVDLYLPVAGLIVLPIFLVLYAMELFLDLRREKLPWRSSVLWAKVSLVLFCIARTIWYAWWLDRTVHRDMAYGVLEALTRGFGLALISTTFILMIVFWLDLLLKTKSLGSNTSMPRFKWGMLAVLGLTCPFIVVYAVLQALGIFHPILFAVYLASMGILILFTFISAVVIMVMAMRWVLRNTASGINRTSQGSRALLAQVRRRSLIIAVEIALVGAYFVVIAAQLFARFELPAVYLVLISASRVVELSHCIVLFFFLENHALQRGSFCASARTQRGDNADVKDEDDLSTDPLSQTTKTTLHFSSEEGAEQIPQHEHHHHHHHHHQQQQQQQQHSRHHHQDRPSNDEDELEEQDDEEGSSAMRPQEAVGSSTLDITPTATTLSSTPSNTSSLSHSHSSDSSH